MIIMPEDTAYRTITILKAIHESDGAAGPVQAAKQMIEAALAVIAREQEPDAARRFLRIGGDAQRPAS